MTKPPTTVTRTTVAFHTIVAQPSAADPAAFKISLTDKHIFYKIAASEEKSKHTQTSMAALLAPNDWDGHMSKVVWMLRWAGVKGF